MNVISIVSIVVSIVTAVAGFVFGMRQRDRRKSAESAMELQDDLTKTQTKTTKTVVKEIADERSEEEFDIGPDFIGLLLFFCCVVSFCHIVPLKICKETIQQKRLLYKEKSRLSCDKC